MVEDIFDEIKIIKKYAKDNNIPIMLDDGIDFLTTYIVKTNAKNILEVGTAIGYSAIMMCLADEKVKVTTIEKDETRYLEALKNIKKLGLENRITLIFKDAMDVILESKFDLIFLDAAKSKNITFFEMFKHNLNSEGTIVTDNIGFHGLVEKNEEEIKSRNLRSLVRKIREFKEYLTENKEFRTTFYNIGDKIAVSEKVQ